MSSGMALLSFLLLTAFLTARAQVSPLEGKTSFKKVSQKILVIVESFIETFSSYLKSECN